MSEAIRCPSCGDPRWIIISEMDDFQYIIEYVCWKCGFKIPAPDKNG